MFIDVGFQITEKCRVNTLNDFYTKNKLTVYFPHEDSTQAFQSSQKKIIITIYIHVYTYTEYIHIVIAYFISLIILIKKLKH